jgi:tRNA-dihydrouridine synthase B
MTLLKPLTIGSVHSFPNLVLAPMSGVTNSCFRRLLREENPGAIGLVVTEFISIEGLTRGNIKSHKMMDFKEIERPLSIQIFGHDISRMVDAAKMAEDAGADIVDINSGCPVPKVVKRGGGCELMRQPLHLGAMLSRVASAIKVPLTLKIRSGWDENSVNASEIARIAEESGVQMLAVHGRTRKDLYRGEADWNIVAQVAGERNIPVVGSGDITSGESAAKALQHGVAGVMIGRGAMENPWIFSEIHAFLSGQEVPSRNHSEIVRVLLRYMALLREEVPPTVMLGRMKQLISQSTRGLPEGTALRRTLCSQKDSTVLEHLLEDLHQTLIIGESSEEGIIARNIKDIHSKGRQVHFNQPPLSPHLTEKHAKKDLSGTCSEGSL